jgi:hypothetical protein
MKSRLTIFINLALVCSLSFVLTLSSVAAGQQGSTEGTSAQRDESLPLWFRYGTLFRRLAGAQSGSQSGSQDSATPAKTNEARYAAMLQREVALSDEQMRILVEIAGECQRQVAEIDTRAKAIIDAARAQSLSAPPPELAELQQERNSTILKAREKLQTALGEDAFQRLDNYVISQGNGRTFTLPQASRPAIPLQATVTVLSADGQMAKKQFHVAEKIIIQIALQNNSLQAISVKEADLYDWFAISRIEETTRVPILIHPPEKEQSTVTTQTEQSVELVPGQQTIVGTFDLSRVQRSLKPGHYEVKAHPRVLLNRPPEKSEFINLKSNDDPVTFEVVP